MGEQAVCLESFDNLEDAIDLVTQWVSDDAGGGVTTADLDAVIAPLERASEVAPLDMAQYYDAVVSVLYDMRGLTIRGGVQTINFEDFRSAGLELISRCGKYAL